MYFEREMLNIIHLFQTSEFIYYLFNISNFEWQHSELFKIQFLFS